MENRNGLQFNNDLWSLGRKKVSSNSGATILMALLLLFLASLVSAVIIKTAGSASRSLRSDREQQQAFLSVSSAAEYMVTQISGTVVEKKKDQDVYQAVTGVDSAFLPLLCQAAKAGGNYDSQFYLNLPNQSSDFSVAVTFSMENYRITAWLSLPEETNPESNYYIKVTIPGSYSEGDSNNTEDDDEESLPRASWSGGTIAKGKKEDENN